MRLFTLCAFALIAAVPLMAENLVFNSSFEMGDAGYACAKYLRPDANPKLEYEGLAIDKSSFVSGRQSLRIPNRFAEAIEFHAKEFKVKPGTEYTCSLWLKSSVENYPLRISAMNNWNVCGAKALAVGKTWSRHSFGFKTSKLDPQNEYCFIRMIGGRSDMPADIWLDDLQVAEGPLQDYEASAVVETFVDCEPLLILGDGKSNAVVRTHMINNSDSPVKGSLTLNAATEDGKTEVLSKPIAIELPPKGDKIVSSEIPFAVYGFYRITPQLETKCSHNALHASLAVIGKYERKPLDVDKSFCVGFNHHEMFQSIVSLPGWKTAGAFGDNPVSPGIRTQAQPNRQMEFLASMGCRVLRIWEPKDFRWAEIEPEEGKFNWLPLNRILEWKEKYGFEVLPVIGGMDFLDPKLGRPYACGSLPAWLKERCQVQQKFPMKGHYKKGSVYLPPIELWRSYVKEIGMRGKGKFAHYEIMNEPNLVFMDANGYVPYLKAAHEELKAVDPSCKILAPCVTGDLGGNVKGFSSGFMRNGGLAYTDIFSFHPYDSPKLDSPVPADRQISELRMRLHENGKDDCPLWNTELYYLNSTSDGRFAPYHPACRFLIDLGEGLRQSICIQSVRVFNNSAMLEHQGKLFDETMNPAGSYVAYNALARLFEGARPIGKWRWFDNIICYAFEKDGQYVAAFWNYANTGGFQMEFPDNSNGVELLDMLGNRLPVKEHSAAISLAPQYLKWKNGNAASVKDFFNNAIISGDKPFRIERSLLLKNIGKALLSVRNMSGKKCDGVAISIDSKRAEIGVFAPMELKEIEVPFQASSSKLKVEISGAGKPFASEEAVAEVNCLPLEEGQPSASMPIEKPVIGKPGSPEDFSASFIASYEGNSLFLNIKVKDDKRGRLAQGIWNEDAAQIYIDAFPMTAGANYPSYADTTYKIEVSAWREGDAKINANGFPGKIQAVTKELPDGYVLDVQLPLGSMPNFKIVKGVKIGFDISVEDSDGDARKTELVWNGSSENWRNRSNFAIAELK